jgi:hypothetical protein
MTTQFDPRQRHADYLETVQTHQDGREAQIHTAMPATVVGYNPGTNTVQVQPAIQAVQTMADGTTKPVTITELHDVPVVFQGGGGHVLTFPVGKGDDCLVVFAERSIDYWHQLGGTQKPSDWRMHDINDGFAFVGVRSTPHVPGGGAGSTKNPGPAISTKTTQLRSDDGKMIIELDPAGPTINIAAAKDVNVSGVHWVVLSANDTVFIQAPNFVDITAPTTTIHGDLHVTGEVIGKFGGNAVTLTQHIHHALNQPPAIGTRAIEPAVITGSNGGIAALKTLLQALETMGLIVDKST